MEIIGKPKVELATHIVELQVVACRTVTRTVRQTISFVGTAHVMSQFFSAVSEQRAKVQISWVVFSKILILLTNTLPVLLLIRVTLLTMCCNIRLQTVHDTSRTVTRTVAHQHNIGLG